MNHEIMVATGAILIVLLVLALSAVGAVHWFAGLVFG